MPVAVHLGRSCRSRGNETTRSIPPPRRSGRSDELKDGEPRRRGGLYLSEKRRIVRGGGERRWILLLLLLLLLPALFDAADATVAAAVNILSPEMERVSEVSEWSDRTD